MTTLPPPGAATGSPHEGRPEPAAGGAAAGDGSVGGGAAADGGAAAVERVLTLFGRAAEDGHTWLPRAMVLDACGAAAVEAAECRGLVVTVEGPAAVVGLAEAGLAEEEELLADGLGALAAEGRLAVVAGGPGPARDAAVQRLRAEALARGVVPRVVDRAERLDVATVLAAVEDVPEDALLLLVGDPAALGPAGPGRVLADVVSAGICPVVPALGGTDARPAPLVALDGAVRRGGLLAPDAEDRAFVVVPVDSDAAAVARAVQIVATSIPRAFGFRGGDVAVLSPLRGGGAGAAALATVFAAAVGGDGKRGGQSPEVLTVHEAAGRQWPAVVLVLPGSAAGVLSRALVLTAIATAGTHLSVVHGAGPDLARAVAGTPERPRRTRLASLLT